MREAIRIATDAFSAVLGNIVPGRTEMEIANELDCTMRRLGAGGTVLRDDCGVRTEGGASPRPATAKKLEAGETVVIDFGCRVDGYCSDETCTVALGEPGKQMREIHEVVFEAKQKGIAPCGRACPCATSTR